MTDPIKPVAVAAPVYEARAARLPSRVAAIAARVAADHYVPSGPGNTTDNAVQVFIDGETAFPQMYDLVKQANKSIQLEFFIMHDDKSTWDMARLLADKAAKGVDVKLLYDPNGSSDLSAKITATMSKGIDPKVLFNGADVNRVIDYLKQHGVQVLPSVKKSLFYTDVDHRKFLLVDGRAGMTGGMNLGDEYQHEWHDLMLRIDGPAVAAMQQKFFEGWRAAGGKGDERPYLAPGLEVPRGGIPTQTASIAKDDASFKQQLFRAIDAAHDTIRMETAYLGDPELHQKLKAAVARGVQVSMILPNFSDVAPLNYPNRAFIDDLQAAGVKVRLYNGGDTRFLHVKATVIDDWWVSLGSANADYKALAKNREFNLIFADSDLARKLNQDLFATDIANSTAVTSKQSLWYLAPLSTIARLVYKLY